jgi:hypothetical protein
MGRVPTPRLLAVLALGVLLGCPAADDDDPPFADDDDSSPDDDDDTVGDDDDDDGIPLGPAGSVVGTLFDIETDQPLQLTVHEHNSDPFNAVQSNTAGYFELYPQVFETDLTTEFFAYDPAGNYVDLFVAMTRGSYLRAGRGLDLFAQPSEGWETTHQKLYGSSWDPGLGLLVFELDYEDLEDVEGTAVWIDAPYDTAFVYDASGALVEASEIPFGSARAQIILTGVSPAPANVEVMPKAGIECFGPSGFDTLDNAILYALYTCRPESR